MSYKLKQNALEIENYVYNRYDKDKEETPMVTFRATSNFNPSDSDDNHVILDTSRLGMSHSVGITEDGAGKLGEFLTKHYGTPKDDPKTAHGLAKDFRALADEADCCANDEPEAASFWKGRATAWEAAARWCEAVSDEG